MEELNHLKASIYIPSSRKRKEYQTKMRGLFQEKYKKLLFFKELIMKLQSIYDNIKVLRIKGCSLPILIIIEVKYPNIKCSISKKEVNFGLILSEKISFKDI